MSHANLNRRSRGDEAVRSSRPTLLTRAAFSTSLRHQVATSLSPRMLTFLSQVPDLTFLTLRFQPAPSAPSAASAASAVKNRFVSIPGFFPTSLRHHVATSLSLRMLTFPSQVPAIINSNDQIACEDFRPNACAHRHARTLNCRLFFCKSLQSSFSLSHHGSRPLFAQRTSLAGQRTRGGVGNATERLLWGNQLVAGLTAKRFVITVVQTLGSPLTDLTLFNPFYPHLLISTRWAEGAPEPISLPAFPTSLRPRLSSAKIRSSPLVSIHGSLFRQTCVILTQPKHPTLDFALSTLHS